MSDQIESEGGEEIERTIYLGLEKVPLILNSPQDLEDWVDGEVSQWSWIGEAPASTFDALQKMGKSLVGLKKFVYDLTPNWRKARDDADGDSEEKLISKIAAHLSALYKYDLVPAASSLTPVLKKYADHNQGGPRETEAILAFRSGGNYDISNGPARDAVLDAHLALNGLHTSELLARDQSVARLQSELQTELKKVQNLLGDLTSGTDTAINKASDLSEKFKKTATFGIKASWRLAQKQRQEVDAEWVTEKQKLHVEFALSEPVKYWKARKFWNYVMAGVLYVATIAGVYWVGSGAFDIAEEYGWIRLLLLLPSEAGEWGRVAVLGLALGLIVALVRIPLNRANGYLHLGNDAGERVAAIRTFLALRAADHIKEAEIEAVVTRIFMPANDGVVKDDIGVVTYFDLLNKFKKGPS